MKTSRILAMVMMAMMSMASVNGYGQSRGNHGGQRELVMHGNGRMEMRGGHESRGGHEMSGAREMRGGRDGYGMHERDYATQHSGREMHGYAGGREMAHRGGFRMGGREFDRRWEGRIRHDNGRWGYYRDNRWYWYDRYFEPDFYFANPLAHFNAHYYICDGGYYPGWEGRVRYAGGRWGYLRGNDWYWYDRFYEPDYYFCHPMSHFHGHMSHTGRAVAGAVVGGVVLGTLISALCH